MTWRRLWAMGVVYGGLPVVLLVAVLDDGPAHGFIAAVCLVYGVSALCLLATSAGQKAVAEAFAHQQRTFGSVLRRSGRS